MTRKPHHDLPAIPEVSTPHEIEDDADDGATIESFAFTLDGVGFDEESGSIMHTPPQLLSPRKMSRRDEVELHRQTCQSLGIPCTEEMSVGSPRDSVPESLESTSTTSVTKNVEMYDVNLNSPKGDTKSLSPSSNTKKSRLITRAKITELASSYANSVKEMAINFSDKSKKIYANSKQKVLTQDGNQNKEKRQISFDPSKYYPTWFIEMNPLMKLTAGMALFFFTLFIVVIVAVSRSSSPHPVERDGTHLMDMTSLSTAFNSTSVTNLDETTGNVPNETSMPSYAPTFSPTASPTGEDSYHCIDKPGNHITSRGKLRTCSWLKTKHLERECGGHGKEPSDLGLNCKLSCSEYNSCIMEIIEETETPTTTPTTKPTNKRRNKKKNKTNDPEDISTTTTSTATTVIEDDGEVYFIDTNDKLRPCSWLDIRNPAVKAKRRDENCPKEAVQALCPVPCLDYVKFDAPTTVAATETTTMAVEYEEIHFSDSSGQQRTCSWLDVRNSRQRTKRRDENCAKITVQIICPESCVDYEDYSIPVTVNKQKRSDDTGLNASEYVRIHDVVPQDECFDRTGYFLNDIGHPVECSWLNENEKEVEMRKDRNCGGLNNATDLGVMCKHSCGTC